MHASVVIAASNIAALYPIAVALANYDIAASLVMTATAAVSVLMHVSETGHGLLSESKTDLKWLDRFATLYAILFLMTRGPVPPTRTLYLLFGGVGALAISKGAKDAPVRYALFHSVWHACAFIAAGDMLVK